MADIPEWAWKARQKWKYTGNKRPPFAKDPGPEQETVWDYPRPPIVDPDHRVITVTHENITIAKSSNAVRILETANAPVFYLPAEGVNHQLLTESERTTQCEWKGKATYWHVNLKNKQLKDAAWSYQDPFPEYMTIKDYFSFYPARVDCYVGGVKARPQPGKFYGGWVTPEITGPIKGKKDTEFW